MYVVRGPGKSLTNNDLFYSYSRTLIFSIHAVYLHLQ